MELPDARLALMRYWRRSQLWHVARLECPDYETFRKSCGAIERAIASQLEDEFPALGRAAHQRPRFASGH